MVMLPSASSPGQVDSDFYTSFLFGIWHEVISRKLNIVFRRVMERHAFSKLPHYGTNSNIHLSIGQTNQKESGSALFIASAWEGQHT